MSETATQRVAVGVATAVIAALLITSYTQYANRPKLSIEVDRVVLKDNLFEVSGRAANYGRDQAGGCSVHFKQLQPGAEMHTTGGWYRTDRIGRDVKPGNPAVTWTERISMDDLKDEVTEQSTGALLVRLWFECNSYPLKSHDITDLNKIPHEDLLLDPWTPAWGRYNATRTQQELITLEPQQR